MSPLFVKVNQFLNQVVAKNALQVTYFFTISFFDDPTFALTVSESDCV
jgi:hypothetical protein